MARTAARPRGRHAPAGARASGAGDTALLAVFFAAALALHAGLLRLPYFWDEAGYFIPAARDLLLSGSVVPQSTLNNIHPPLVSAWLALCWKLAGYHVVVTRVAMLFVAAFALLGIYRLARLLANREVAIAAAALTALFPVFFAQSTLANLDLAAAAFTLWGIERHLAGRAWPAAAYFSLAVLAKETALLAPLGIFAWEAFCRLLGGRQPALRTLVTPRPGRDLAVLLFPLLPLAAWIGYHYALTGWLLGNPEFVRYNVEGTLSATRFLLALAQRLWHLFGHMGMLALTLAAAVAMLFAPAAESDGSPRRRIPAAAQAVLMAVIAAYLLALSVVGGALLPRYLLPVYPLVILLAVATLRRRIREWPWLVVAIGAIFVAAWFWRPPYHFAPEDNLAYADFVRLQQGGAQALAQKYPHATVLTAWPASDELTRPWLGYVAQPLRVVRLENFTLDNVTAAQHATVPFDVVFAFATKYQPARNLAGPRWWQAAQSRYFDYHRDLPPEAITHMLGGKITWLERRDGLWAAVIEIPQSRLAKISPKPNQQDRGKREASEAVAVPGREAWGWAAADWARSRAWGSRR
jgi:hypothetical protein